MSGRSQNGQKVTGVGSVTKKDCMWKYLCRSLLWSPDRSVPLWSRWLHIVMGTLAASGSVSNQNWYFVTDTEDSPLVCVGGVGDTL